MPTCRVLLLAAALTAASLPARAASDRPAGMAALEQLPGVYRVASRGSLSCNVFVVLTPEPVLIDAGSRPCWDELVENLGLLGLKISDLRWVLGTHGHWDHVDNVARIQRENPQARFALHAGDVQFVINNDRVFSCADTLYKTYDSEPIRVDRILLDGDRITVGRQTFRIIHTPGHTPGSIVIVTRIGGKQVGFCSDSVAGFYSLSNRSSLIDWEASLRRLLTEDIDILFTGHGSKPVEGKDRIKAWLERSLAAVVVKRKMLAAEEQYQHLSNLLDRAP